MNSYAKKTAAASRKVAQHGTKGRKALQDGNAGKDIKDFYLVQLLL